jgi:hypothetical protein
MECSYDGAIFQQLAEIGTAYRRWRESGDKLDCLGDIICRHELYDIIGVPLLHRHFELRPYERLIREHHGDTFSSKPHACLTQDDFIPCLWKVGRQSKSGEWTYIPLEFARTTGSGVAYKIHHDKIFSKKDFLLEMGQKIWELDVADLFGIAIIPAGFKPRHADEVLLERQDLTHRVNTAHQVSTSSFGSRINLPSLWAFQPLRD